MRLLLDTHTLLWGMTMTRLLPQRILRMLEDNDNEIYFSSMSIFELAIRRSSKSRSAPPVSIDMVVTLAERSRLRELALTAEHAQNMETIALAHPDRFDRLLLAQAHVEGLQLVTHDARLAAFDSRTILF